MDKRYILALVLITVVMIAWMFLQPIVRKKSIIDGTISDKTTGMPLQGASITLLKNEETIIAQTLTDARGNYSLGQVTPGGYVIRATKTAYETTQKNINLKSGIQMTVDFQLSPSTPFDQKEIKQQEVSKEPVIIPQGEVETTEEYQEISESDEVRIETNYYDAKFLIDTATISSWKLKKYTKRGSENGEVVDLIPPRTALPSYKHCSGITFPGPENIEWYEVDNQKSSITFKGRIKNKLEVMKKYTFHQDNYVADLEITFDNISDKRYPENEENSNYILRWGPGITSDDKKGDRGYGIKDYRPKRSDSEDEPPIIWAAMYGRYFAAAIIPEKDAQYRKNDELTTKNQVQYVTSPSDAVDVIIPGFDAGERRTDRFTLYIGPKDGALLKQVRAPGSDEPIYLNKLIKLGWFWPLAKGLLWFLNAIYAVTRNYGIAIIVVATLLKVALYPLTRKSYQSMKEMQKLKEPLEELKEKYRDDPQKLNKATMRLYKEHGVSPLSGCIVQLPQMPILFAFFSVLREVIELRGAGFMLWISDLSVPDTLATIPINIPIPFIADENGISIRILPLLMGAAMYIQQKFGGAPGADPRQSKMMAFMPIIMTFFFYGFPSGLVLYWLWSNVLTIAQQYMINKKGNDDMVEKTEQKTNKEKKQNSGTSSLQRKLREARSNTRKRTKKR